MEPDIDKSELMSRRDIAKYLDVSLETLKRWEYGKGGRKPQNFPPPDVVSGMHFWWKATIDHWNDNVRSELSRRWKGLQQ